MYQVTKLLENEKKTWNMSEKQNSRMATLLKKRTIQVDGLEACAW